MKLHVVRRRDGGPGAAIAVCGRTGGFPIVGWDKYLDEYYDPLTFEFVHADGVCGACHDILHRRHGIRKGPIPPLKPATAGSPAQVKL